jgi:hypothetical protein
VCGIAREQGFISCYDAPMEFDASNWSGEGAFAQALIDVLKSDSAIAVLTVEDAPASRSDASFSFISTEIYVGFTRTHEAGTAMPALALTLEQVSSIGAPDYADESMLQYLRTERIVPPYQTRGFKVIEMVRIYEAGTPPRGRVGM